MLAVFKREEESTSLNRLGCNSSRCAICNVCQWLGMQITYNDRGEHGDAFCTACAKVNVCLRISHSCKFPGVRQLLK